MTTKRRDSLRHDGEGRTLAAAVNNENNNGAPQRNGEFRSISALEAEILRLQESLNGTSSSSSSDASVTDEEDDRGALKGQKWGEEAEDLFLERDEHGRVLRMVSRLGESERIQPLPPSLLPAAQCKASLHASPAGLANRTKAIRFSDENHAASKRPRTQSDSKGAKSSGPDVQQSGMEKTVREMLRNYQPSERTPFYCRYCRFQGVDLRSWEEHNATDVHLCAVRMERKMSYCRICKKQFTSPDQLKEHQKGKIHVQRMERIRGTTQDGKRQFS